MANTVDQLTRQRWVDPFPVRSYLAELRRRQSTTMNSRTELGWNVKEYIYSRSSHSCTSVNPLSMVSSRTAPPLPVGPMVKCACPVDSNRNRSVILWRLNSVPWTRTSNRSSLTESRCSLFFTWKRWQWRGAQQEEATQLSPATNRLLRKNKARY